MNTKETALIGLVAAVFAIVCCQMFVRAAGHHPQLSSAQASAGLTICLAGVVVGVLIVLCVSAFQDAGSGWERSLGAVGLAFGCALLFVLVVRHTPLSDSAAQTQEPTSAHWLAALHRAPLLAPGASR